MFIFLLNLLIGNMQAMEKNQVTEIPNSEKNYTASNSLIRISLQTCNNSTNRRKISGFVTESEQKISTMVESFAKNVRVVFWGFPLSYDELTQLKAQNKQKKLGNLIVDHFKASAQLLQLLQLTNKLDMKENSRALINWHLLEREIQQKGGMPMLGAHYPLNPIREKFSEFFNSRNQITAQIASFSGELIKNLTQSFGEIFANNPFSNFAHSEREIFRLIIDSFINTLDSAFAILTNHLRQKEYSTESFFSLCKTIDSEHKENVKNVYTAIFKKKERKQSEVLLSFQKEQKKKTENRNQKDFPEGDLLREHEALPYFPQEQKEKTEKREQKELPEADLSTESVFAKYLKYFETDSFEQKTNILKEIEFFCAEDTNPYILNMLNAIIQDYENLASQTRNKQAVQLAEEVCKQRMIALEEKKLLESLSQFYENLEYFPKEHQLIDYIKKFVNALGGTFRETQSGGICFDLDRYTVGTHFNHGRDDHADKNKATSFRRFMKIFIPTAMIVKK